MRCGLRIKLNEMQKQSIQKEHNIKIKFVSNIICELATIWYFFEGG